MVYHGVHISAGYEEAQPGLSQHPDALRIFPVRLGDDPHLVAVRLQKPGYDGVSEGGVVHIGVTAHIDKVTLVPAADIHIGAVHWQVIVYHIAAPFLFIIS